MTFLICTFYTAEISGYNEGENGGVKDVIPSQVTKTSP